MSPRQTNVLAIEETHIFSKSHHQSSLKTRHFSTINSIIVKTHHSEWACLPIEPILRLRGLNQLKSLLSVVIVIILEGFIASPR